MPYITHLGDGIFVGILGILLLFKKVRTGLYVLISFAAAGIFVQSLKLFVFENHFRPVKYFAKKGIEINTVPDYTNFMDFSFPSGHTTIAFVVFFGLALITKNQISKFLLFVFAILIGYFRIYLSQHFPQDVLVGSLVGVVFAILSIKIISSWKKPWLDKSLIQILKKS